MSPVQGPAIIAGLLLLLSGCVGDSADPAATTSPTIEAPTPTADVDTGAVAGSVIDEEVLPISGAAVSFAEREETTTTDAAGKFTFNALPPGAYRLFVEKLGYASTGIRINVVAGEVVDVKITLKAIAIAEEPWHVSLPRVAQMHVAVTLVNTLQNQSAVNSLACDPCKFVIHFEPAPMAVVSEAKWTTTGQPAINSGLNWHHYRTWTNDGGYTSDACHLQPNSQPYKRVWTEGCVGNVKKSDKFMLVIQPGPVPGLVAIENRVETWTTFAYHAELPDDFTAMAR